MKLKKIKRRLKAYIRVGYLWYPIGAFIILMELKPYIDIVYNFIRHLLD